MAQIFCYARVSSLDQNTEMQESALMKRFPNGLLRSEKSSATTMERSVLKLILDMMSKGDKLVVWKLDRLARNVSDLLKIVDMIKEKEATLVVMDQQIDTSTASGRAFLQMLGVFAEFETNLRRERQAAGIARAKALGKQMGRPSRLSNKQKIELRKDSACTTIAELSIKYGVSRGTVYNVLNEA
jgi:DNA invertase Pin-like site-specific DNA recombinase